MADQAERLRTKMNHAQSNPTKCKTIAVVSGKGGVGKSTTTVNFAIELQKRGKRTLLFDFDVGMGNIDILLGKQSKHTIVNLFHDFLPIHDMIELGPKGLSYIAGGSGLNELVELDEDKLNYFFSQYEKLTEEYDYIFFDLGAGVSSDSLMLISAADECFVITTPEPTSIADAYSMIKHIVNRGAAVPIYVIMNRSQSVHEGNKVLNKFSDVVKQFLNYDMIQLGSLPNDPIVVQAVIKQVPYVILKQNANVSKSLKRIVENYLKDNNMTEEQSKSFIQKLKTLLTVRR